MPDRYRIIISPRASADLHGVHKYIETESPQNAAGVLDALIRAINSLEQLPHRHRVYQGRREPSAAVRRMPVPPYLVYYRVDDKNRPVEVVTVRHGRRRQPRRFG